MRLPGTRKYALNGGKVRSQMEDGWKVGILFLNIFVIKVSYIQKNEKNSTVIAPIPTIYIETL